MARAQISVEFLIFLGVTFIIAISFQIVSIKNLNEFNLKREDEQLKDIGLKIQRELFIASTVEDGYVRHFDIQDKVGRLNYTITSLNSSITLESENSVFAAKIPSSKGILAKGTNIINKTNGNIKIN